MSRKTSLHGINQEKTILLVEDERITARAAEKTLKKYGYKVLRVYTGDDAVETVRKNPLIDLILMDIDLGLGIDGTEAAKQILLTNNIPLVFMSSHTEPEVVEKTEGITSYGYIVKNSGETVLNASIRMAFKLFEEKERVRKHEQNLIAANEELLAANKQLEASQHQILEHDKALQESDERYRSFIALGKDGVCRWEFTKPLPTVLPLKEQVNWAKENVYVAECNDVFARQYGYTDSSEVTGMQAVEIFGGDEAATKQFELWIKKNYQWKNLETHERAKDGRERYFLSNVVSVFENETILRVWSTQTDITRRIQTEEKFRMFFDKLPIGAYKTTVEGKVIEANDAAVRMFAYNTVEEMKNNVENIASEHYVSPEKRSSTILRKTPDEIIQYSVQLRRKDNSLFTGNLINRKFVEDGVTYVVGTIEDVTEDKQLEKIQAAQLRLIDYAATNNSSELMQKLLDEAELLTKSKISFCHFLEDDQQTLTLQTWSTNTKENMCKAEASGMHYPISEAGVWVDCVHEGKPVIHNDYESLSNKKGLPEGHAPVFRELVVPVFRGEKIKAILGVGNKKTDYDQKDVKTIQQLANLAWEMIVRKQAEGTLRENNEHLRFALQAANMGTWEWDLQKNFVMWSPETLMIFGVSGDEFGHSYESYMSFAVPEARDEIDEIVGSFLAEARQNSVIQYAHEIIRGDGSKSWIEVRGTLYLDEKGEPEKLRGVCSDISARKESDKALHSEREFTVSALDAQEDTFFLFEPETGRAVRWNRSFQETTGYTDEEIEKQPAPVSYYSAEEIEKASVFIEGVIENGTGTIELELICKDGRKIPTEYRVSVINDDKGDPKYIISIGRDITARRKTENMLKESEERFRTMFEQSPDCWYIRDLEGKPLKANQSMLDLFGYSWEEFETLDRDDLYVLEKEEIEAVREAWKKLLAEGGAHFEAKFKKKSGEIFFGEVTSSIVEISGEKYIQGILRNTTERNIMENRLRQSEKMEAIGHLAGGIAHDFNNMLAGIFGYATMSLDKAEPGSLLERNLQQILKAGVRAKQMVQQILTFSRQDKEEKLLIDLHPVVHEAIEMLKVSVPSSVVMSVNIDQDTKPVLADSTKVHEIILNLATNSVQAMDEKGNLRISLYEKEMLESEQGILDIIRPGCYSIIEVADDGPGIGDDIMPNIFEPYYTTKETGEGTGLGLAVIYGIMQSHNGNIQVNTEKAKGTVFRLFFPESKVDGDVVEEETSELLLGSENILLVDDEEMMIDVGTSLLLSLGYKVTARSDSREALKLFYTNPSDFDLIITDQTMPSLTGLELASEIRNVAPDIPIILCTGYSTKVNKNTLQTIGIHSLLMKPYKKSELATVIREALD